MVTRYLEADKVTLQTRPPLFVEGGHCQWCYKELTGKATRYCRPDPDYLYSNVSDCAVSFLNWWCSRPAFVRATFIKDNFTCQECGLHPVRKDRPWLPGISLLECDHILPVSRGGETEMENLQTLCTRCNKKKGVTVPPGYKPKPRRQEADREQCLPEIGGNLLPPGVEPLCGWPWVWENMRKGYPEQGITVFFDGEAIVAVSSTSSQRGAIKSAMKNAGSAT